jgi:Mn2+/Fe2+ NRAMP family transporter
MTAAQSGAQWGYQLLLLQFLVIPLLFMVQELTVRLATGTGCGFGELILRRFGRGWALLAIATLVISCFGALVTQLVGLAGVGQLFGVPVRLTVGLTVSFIILMALTGSYVSVERIALGLGLFELAFLVVAWKAAPDSGEVFGQLVDMPLGDSGYLYLLAANLGTTIMPWAVFYQQSAIVDKGLQPGHLRVARLETLGGAILCQLVTAAVLVAAAATVGEHGNGLGLASVADIAAAFTSVLGATTGRMVFAVGLTGAALVTTIVVSLTAAWAIGEVAGLHHSLEHRPLEAPWFYAAFAAVLVAGGVFVGSGVDPIRLSLATGVINAVLLPIVLGLLYLLAHSELAEPYRLRGRYAGLVGLLFVATSLVALYSGIVGAFG